jgi:hypothetical protein
VNFFLKFPGSIIESIDSNDNKGKTLQGSHALAKERGDWKGESEVLAWLEHSSS